MLGAGSSWSTCGTQVCNHPDLFEGRPIVSAYDPPPLQLPVPSCIVYGQLAPPPLHDAVPLLLHEGLALGVAPPRRSEAITNEAAAPRFFGDCGGGGSSAVLSMARGLLIAHPSAMAASTAWDAARVEALQTTYPDMASQCLTPTPGAL